MASEALCDLNSASLCSSISFFPLDSLCSLVPVTFFLPLEHIRLRASALFLLRILAVYHSDLNSDSQRFLLFLAKVSAPASSLLPVILFSHLIVILSHFIISIAFINLWVSIIIWLYFYTLLNVSSLRVYYVSTLYTLVISK